ncbi:MAG: heme ABC exporter ATP-binding protein CcmA [Bacillota bacterium]|jgi:heme exporter protein A|nr:MAG: heme ABC exporter ATP-binding protein CcmA [Bacillota bacterium]
MSEDTGVLARDLALRLGDNQVLRGVSFGIEPGTVLAVLGPNGAGKTSLLKVLATLLAPTGGEVRVLGRNLRDAGAALRRLIGYVAHQTFLYPQLTGWENLYFWARAYGVRKAGDRAEELLAFVGLELHAHETVRAYSRGMQQRLALARALAHDPRLLLLDEPYTGLDRRATDLLDVIIRESRPQGRTVIMTSHDPTRAIRASDTVVVLRRGQVALLADSRDVDPALVDDAADPSGGRMVVQ